MELVTAEAILLDVIDLQEYDRIVEFLTVERGRKRGVAQGARRKHSRYAGQLQPLEKVRVTWISVRKEGDSLVVAGAVRPRGMFPGCRRGHVDVEVLDSNGRLLAEGHSRDVYVHSRVGSPKIKRFTVTLPLSPPQDSLIRVTHHPGSAETQHRGTAAD